jgi:hypothetical protein
MRIPSIEDLPAATTRAGWAKELACNQSTLFRAEREKKLRRANPGSAQVIYLRRDILAWLGIGQEIAVEPPTLKALRRAARAFPK